MDAGRVRRFYSYPYFQSNFKNVVSKVLVFSVLSSYENTQTETIATKQDMLTPFSEKGIFIQIRERIKYDNSFSSENKGKIIEKKNSREKKR